MAAVGAEAGVRGDPAVASGAYSRAETITAMYSARYVATSRLLFNGLAIMTVPQLVAGVVVLALYGTFKAGDLGYDSSFWILVQLLRLSATLLFKGAMLWKMVSGRWTPQQVNASKWQNGTFNVV